MMKSKKRSPLRWAVAVLLLLGVLAVWYVRAHPRIFNESFFSHAHCIKQAGIALSMYASDHGNAFPAHTNGYGDALLLVSDGTYFPMLTGPGYSDRVFREAQAAGSDVDESQCGRVYVPGLKTDSNPDIVLLFDKLPTPGDHSHGFRRLRGRFGREVWSVGRGMSFIRVEDWPGFAEQQIRLLIAEGFPEALARSYYENLPE